MTVLEAFLEAGKRLGESREQVELKLRDAKKKNKTIAALCMEKELRDEVAMELVDMCVRIAVMQDNGFGRN
jgi:hypothetical protein